MDRRVIAFACGILVLAATLAPADTFTHKQTGEVFHGFPTLKSQGGRTLTYNQEKDELAPMNLSEYEIEYNFQGRRDSVVVVPITQREVLISDEVANAVTELLTKAANTGPRFIILQIDNPGGRADTMKQVASMLTSIDNLPVYSYITAKEFGGAYSAAAIVAMATEKIYMAPTAVMGSLAPVVGRSVTDETMDVYYETYSPDNLAAFRSYAAALAEQQGRPAAVAMAMLDKSLQVQEVEGADGQRRFISAPGERRDTEKVIRTWSTREAIAGAQPTPSTPQTAYGQPGAEIAPVPSTGADYVLTIKASDAVLIDLADQIADGFNEILQDQNSADAKLVFSSGIDGAVRRYAALKRNLNQTLSNVTYLENRVSSLQQALNQVEQQLRESTVQRQVRSRNPALGYDYGFRTGTRIRGYRDRFDQTYRDARDGVLYSRRGVDPDILDRYPDAESLQVELPLMSPVQVMQELAGTLVTLSREYRQAINLARRDPGALPPDVSLAALRQNLNMAETMANDLRRRATGTNYIQPPRRR